MEDTQPLPLQLFCPLQELLAVAQSDVPLHELIPLQCTLACFILISDELPELLAQPDSIKVAAAAAIAVVVNFLTVLIIVTSINLLRNFKWAAGRTILKGNTCEIS